MKTIRIGDVVGEYKVIGTAGAGGMGTVYKIEHVITRRVEAMKLMPSGMDTDPDQVQRFEREIQLQARLHHPNLVTLYNAVRDGESIALIMEFVEGQSLQRRLEVGALPVWTAVKFAMQVLGGLAYAHKSGVVHRDVTPANIIITQDQEAKLTDFGLALSTADSRQPTSGEPAGSPSYMSPEQIKGANDLDARTDIYAMGAVLHEMLTGRKLFDAGGAFAIFRAHVEAEPEPPSKINPKVPATLDRIVGTAVAKDPAMRFQSAAEFRQALQRFALDTRTAPEPPGPRKARKKIFARLPVQLPANWPAREFQVIALAPILLVGFYAVKLVPYAGRGRSAELVSSGVRNPSAPLQSDAGPQPPAAAESAKVDPLPASKDPTAIVNPPAASPAAGVRHNRQKKEPEATAAAPAPTRNTALLLEPPKADERRPVLAATPPELPIRADDGVPQPVAPDVTAENPETGNRFLKALGKVNPFRRWTKRDAAKSERRPD